MLKVGQKVKILEGREGYAPPTHIPGESVYRIENIQDDLVIISSGGPYDNWAIDMRYVRALVKKKPDKILFQAIIPITLKGEIDWLNKVQKNFRYPSEVHATNRITVPEPMFRGVTLTTNGTGNGRWEEPIVNNEAGLQVELNRAANQAAAAHQMAQQQGNMQHVGQVGQWATAHDIINEIVDAGTIRLDVTDIEPQDPNVLRRR